MTVTYTAEVATCKKFGSFIKLLARWRGSIYKIIWKDLVLFLALYYCINLIYFFVLENESKETFESIVYYCASYSSLIPLSFVLGFYVNLVMTRWWEQYMTIPWPDSIAVFVSTYVHGQDEGGRLMRRTVMRYVCLCLTIALRMISPCVKKRFPKLKNLVDAGLLLENEKGILEAMECSFPKYPKHWLPIVWAASIITRARKEGRIRDDFAVKTIIDELNNFRGLCGILMYYDFISIPLVYTQVVTIAVYSFFVCSLLAHQCTDKKKDTYEVLDFYSPIFITLQFFFYMGWLKVAETLINPFGEDDDDFEVNWMIDRNLQVSYLIVDEMHHEHPELVRDQYWDEVYPNELPYESEAKREQPPEPSTAKYDFEDCSKSAASKPQSLANCVVMNGKSHLSMQSSLNRHGEDFNEAFQRFIIYSEDEATNLRSDVENSFQSVSDIENIEHITSYAYSDQSEIQSQVENENMKNTSMLEPIMEVSEEIFEPAEEEEMPNVEEEVGTIETQSSYESDSDNDPFERLRIERQQQRLQRMNDYLERHFGTNFQIVRQFSAASETKPKTYAGEAISTRANKEEEILVDLENYENLPTSSTVSTAYISLQPNAAPSLLDIENDSKFLTSEVSNVISIPRTSAGTLISTTHDKNTQHEKTIISQQDKESPVSSNFTDNNRILESSSVRETSGETQIVLLQQNSKDILLSSELSPQSSHLSIQPKSGDNGQEYSDLEENILGDTSTISTMPLPLKQRSLSSIQLGQESLTPLTKSADLNESVSQDVSSTSTIITRSSFSAPQMQPFNIYLHPEDKSTESLQTEKLIADEGQNSISLNIEQNSNIPNASEYSLKSKDTFILGSARSLSTQSSFLDDFEMLPSRSSLATKEYRLDIEGSEDESNE